MASSTATPYQELLDSTTDDEDFVRATFALMESDLRTLALAALANWSAADLNEAAELLFQAVGTLQRPAWGAWNGLLQALAKARRKIAREADAATRKRLEEATTLTVILMALERKPNATLRAALQPLITLTRHQGGLTAQQVLSLPIRLRNRAAHDNWSDAALWAQAAAALRPLVQWLADPESVLPLPESALHPAPFFFRRDDQWWAFNGIDEAGAIYVASGGASLVSRENLAAVLLLFQGVLGKTAEQEESFRRWLGKLAPESLKGVLLGDFLVGRPVGQGGFATVHKGVQLSTGRQVAVKILRDGLPEEARLRFQQEAAFLARCDHPHIVGVIDHGEGPWSAPRGYSLESEDWYTDFARSAPIKNFMALEWIDGHTLENHIRGAVEPAPNLATKVGWFLDAAEALINVHANGLIHRDIKPGNLMVTAAGVIKLMDFGIARTQVEERTIMTVTGQGLGTPAYMAPEQIRAEEAALEVGPAADIYGLCATFYEVLTGTRLYHHDRESAETVRTQKLTGQLPPAPRTQAPGLEWELETILLGGLQPEVSDRYRSAEALARDLHHVRNDEPIQYRRPSLARRMRLTYRRNRTLINTAGVFCVVIVLMTAWYLVDITQEQQRTAEHAALLQTKLARTRLQEGAVDDALLLILDAARVYTDSTVPDEMLIAFYRALVAASHQTIYDIPPNADIFDLKDAFYIVNSETHEILRFDGSGSPQIVWRSHRPIRSLGLHPNGKDLILIGKDLRVDLVKWRDESDQILGQLTQPSIPQGYELDESTLEIMQDGLIVLQNRFKSLDESSFEFPLYYDVIDAVTGRKYSGHLPDNAEFLSYAPIPGLGRHLVAREVDETSYKVTARPIVQIDREIADDTPAPSKVETEYSYKILMYSCFGSPDRRIEPFANVLREKLLSENYDVRSACHLLDQSVLIHSWWNTSAGRENEYLLIDKDGTKINLLEDGAIPRREPAFIKFDSSGSEIAIMVDRELYLMSDPQQTQGAVTAQIRVPFSTAFGRFFQKDKFVLIDRYRGRIVLLTSLEDLSEKRISPYDNPDNVDLPEDEFNEKESWKIDNLYQRGTCVGYFMNLGESPTLNMPSREEIVLPDRTLTNGGDGSEITIKKRDKDYKIKISPKDFRCIQFSRDLKRMLVLPENGDVKIYDFEMTLRNLTLDGALIGEVKDSLIFSAFFTGASNEIVTAGKKGGVSELLLWKPQPASIQWSSSQIYRGDGLVFYAEPDQDGKRILLIEDIGDGDRRGVLYSIDAQEEMIDLGTDYKWLGLAFTDELEILVTKRAFASEPVKLLSFDELVENADSALSKNCKPTTPGYYRTSKCWTID